MKNDLMNRKHRAKSRLLAGICFGRLKRGASSVLVIGLLAEGAFAAQRSREGPMF
jgi:hypothetical protein